MITIPTTELIGGLSDVLPIITDPKGALAGVKVAWDGKALHFTTYDVLSGGTVYWMPGKGAESVDESDDGPVDDVPWGGEDDPWSVWLWLPQAKEILKVFKLPAKLWRFPVTIKCSPTGDRLIIEREDGPRVGRLLMLPTDSSMLAKVPDVRAVADAVDDSPAAPVESAHFAHYRLGAFGAARAHGTMSMAFAPEGQPTGVYIGWRFAGFIYPAGAQGVRPFNLLRDEAVS